MDSSFNLGVVTATTLALGFLADALLAPALMVLATRSRDAEWPAAVANSRAHEGEIA